MKDLFFAALANCPADYAEIRYEYFDGSEFSYRGIELETAGSNSRSAGIVRACVKGGWGICEFVNLDNLRQKVLEACADAALIGKETTMLAEYEPIPDLISKAEFINDFRGISYSDKLALIKAYNEQILGANSDIESSQVSYTERFRQIYFASTRGIYHYKELPQVILAMSAIARKDGQVQRSAESFSSKDDYNIVLNREAAAAELAQRASDLLKAPKCEAGRHTVVLRPDFAGVFIHEAFGHLSEADFLFENEPMQKLMQIGRKVGVKELNVVDDGTMPGMLGSQPVDDEGTPTQCTELIRNGELAGHLHSLETAGKMKAKPSGNARSIGAGHSPIVRMTNTYIKPGKLSKEELFAGVDDGIYACGLYGGQTMMEMFTFSAAHAFRIRNGKIAELLRDVVMSGNVFETLNNIDGIGNDLSIINRGGGCGKGGQSPLPVTFGGPHLRIRDVLIGG
ncbi:MAG: TldD/PmbA family protein [Oligosphaeraceae bacterium]|nr:TldD/PmbA family protein [Oligosphaeraceae bacterium]